MRTTIVGVPLSQVIVTATTRSDRRKPVVTPCSIFPLCRVDHPLAGSTLQWTTSPEHSATTKPPGVDCEVTPEPAGLDGAVLVGAAVCVEDEDEGDDGN